MATKKVVSANFKPTHRALRPVKFMGVIYGPGLPDGDLLQLDDGTAENLGSSAVAPYSTPVSSMTSDQLADAAKDAAAREKAATSGATA